MVTKFEELIVWQRARELNRRVYRMTAQQEIARDRDLTDQFRRSSISVMNNIAEGFERYRRAEFLQFLSISKGSAGEIRSMLYAALDIGYINQQEFDSMLIEAIELGKSIGRFRSGLAKSDEKPKPGARRKQQVADPETHP